MKEDKYLGIDLSKLLINEIEWKEERSEHIGSRSKRYGPKEFDIRNYQEVQDSGS